MKRLVLVLLMLTLTSVGSPRLTAQGRGGTGGGEGGMATPQLPMHLVDNFLKYPENWIPLEVVAVAVNSKGHVFVGNRGNHPLLEFDANGTFVRSIAEGSQMFEGVHSVRFDPQDNLWYVDAATNLIVKMDPQNRIQMVLGRRPEPWVWLTHVIEHAIPGPDAFYQPTDVTWGPDGSVYVSDGYGNSRVAKFTKEGNLVKHWGERGGSNGNFNTPHSIVLDKNQNLYVADRGNSRIQLFDTDGNFKAVWNNLPGAPWSLCLTPNQVMYVGSVGRIYKLDLTGKVLGSFGHMGRTPGTVDWVHAVACPDEKTVYVAEELGWRLDKLVAQ